MAEVEKPMAGMCKTTALAGFYSVIQVAFAVLFIWTYAKHPLFPVPSSDASWGKAWLITWVADYYLAAACICGIILASESWCCGIMWSLLVLVLGAPCACAYLVVRITCHGTAALAPSSLEPSRCATRCYQVFYTILGIAFIARLSWTLKQYPLYPLDTGNPEWGLAWVITTIGDTYTACLVLCGIIALSESGVADMFWIFVIALTGGFGSCLYMVYRIACHGSIRLASKSVNWAPLAPA